MEENYPDAQDSESLIVSEIVESIVEQSKDNERRLSNEVNPHDRLYQLALEKFKRTEEKQKVPPIGCTFKPQLITSKNSSKIKKDAGLNEKAADQAVDNNEDEDEYEFDRFEQLYLDAKERDNKQAKFTLLYSLEQTHQPIIYSKKSQKVDGTFEERRKTAEDRFSNHIRAMKEASERKAQEECTFKPVMLTRSHSAGAIRRKSKMTDTNDINFDSDSPNESNSNNNNNNSNSNNRQGSRKAAAVHTVPMHERVSEAEKHRKEKIEALRQKLEAEKAQELIFSPQLATRSSSRGKTRRSSTAGGGENGVDDSSLSSPSASASACRDNWLSHRIMPTVPLHERMARMEEDRQKKLEALKERVEKEMGLLFQPTIARTPSRYKNLGRSQEFLTAAASPDPKHSNSINGGGGGGSESSNELTPPLPRNNRESGDATGSVSGLDSILSLSMDPANPGLTSPSSTLTSSMSFAAATGGESTAPLATTTTAARSSITIKNVHERLAAEAEERKSRLEALRQKLEAEKTQELIFSPQLATRSSSRGKTRNSMMKKDSSDPSSPVNQTTTEKEEVVPVYERLVAYDVERQRKLSMMREKMQLELAQELSFQPILRSSSRGKLRPEDGNSETPATGPIGLSVFERLAAHAQAMLAAAKSAEPFVDPEATFKPVIPVLKSKGGNRIDTASSSSMSIFDRLNATNTKGRSGDFPPDPELTFHPAMNPTSRSISASKRRGSDASSATGSTNSIHERLYKYSSIKKEIMERMEREKEKQSLAGCTFSPRIPSSSSTAAAAAAASHIADRPFWERLAPCEEEIAQARMKKEQLKTMRELEACTFRPAIITPTRSSSAGRGRIGSEKGERDWGMLTDDQLPSDRDQGQGPGSPEQGAMSSVTASPQYPVSPDTAVAEGTPPVHTGKWTKTPPAQRATTPSSTSGRRSSSTPAGADREGRNSLSIDVANSDKRTEMRRTTDRQRDAMTGRIPSGNSFKGLENAKINRSASRESMKKVRGGGGGGGGGLTTTTTTSSEKYASPTISLMAAKAEIEGKQPKKVIDTADKDKDKDKGNMQTPIQPNKRRNDNKTSNEVPVATSTVSATGTAAGSALPPAPPPVFTPRTRRTPPTPISITANLATTATTTTATNSSSHTQTATTTTTTTATASAPTRRKSLSQDTTIICVPDSSFNLSSLASESECLLFSPIKVDDPSSVESSGSGSDPSVAVVSSETAARVTSASTETETETDVIPNEVVAVSPALPSDSAPVDIEVDVTVSSTTSDNIALIPEEREATTTAAFSSTAATIVGSSGLNDSEIVTDKDTDSTTAIIVDCNINKMTETTN